jgi:hypothetical protein
VQDGPRAGDDHDGEDEHGFGEVARLDVVDGRGGTQQGEHGDHQHHGPEAEHHLDLAQQVPQAACRGPAWARRSKNLVAKVCRMAMAKSAAPMISMGVAVTRGSWGMGGQEVLS